MERDLRGGGALQGLENHSKYISPYFIYWPRQKGWLNQEKSAKGFQLVSKELEKYAVIISLRKSNRSKCE